MKEILTPEENALDTGPEPNLPMTETPELLPCPFCGANVRMSSEDSYHQVLCQDCGSKAAEYPNDMLAAIAWNTRAPSTVGVEAICGACGAPWQEGMLCGQKDNGHPFPVCYKFSPALQSPTIASETEGGKVTNYDELAKGSDKVLRDLAIIVMSEQTGNRSLMATAEAAVQEILRLRAAPPAASLIAKGEGK